MDVRSLESALMIVNEEMRATEQEFEELKLKKERLQAIVLNLTALLRDSARTAASSREPIPIADRTLPETAVSARLPVAIDGKPSWRIIQEIFPKGGGSFTVPEIHKLVNATSSVIPNPDAIRVAMRRHPEVFNNVNGRFSLVNPEPLEGDPLNAKEAAEAAS